MSFRRRTPALSRGFQVKREAPNGSAPPQRGVIASARRLGRDRKGVATIEMVLLLPLYMMLIVMAFDIGITFYSLTRMHDVARYAARRASTGELSASEAKAYAEASLPGHATFDVQVFNNAGGDVVVSITSDNISPFFGFIEMFTPDAMTASYVMRSEFANG